MRRACNHWHVCKYIKFQNSNCFEIKKNTLILKIDWKYSKYQNLRIKTHFKQKMKIEEKMLMSKYKSQILKLQTLKNIIL